MTRLLPLGLASILLLNLVACMPAPMTDQSASADSGIKEQTVDTNHAMTDTMMNDSHSMTETMTTDSQIMSDTEAMAGEEVMMELPAWMMLPMTNARTGESMAFADLKGKTIFVETMATWCPNCRRQLGNVKAAHAQNSNRDVVFIAISVETDLAAEQLAQYAESNGFDWFFAVSSPEMLTELVNTFGQTIANPPATPHFIIKADGTVGPLVTGFEEAEEILAALQS